jgi:hypothetical protein
MARADPSGGLEKCWRGKELLRVLLALAGTEPDRTRIWNALAAFYTHCADSGVSQLRRLAWTINAWQSSVVAGIITGISNGRTEGYNRNRQERRADRVRLPQPGESETPDTLRLHPSIPPGVNRWPPPLLTPKSHKIGRLPPMRTSRGRVITQPFDAMDRCPQPGHQPVSSGAVEQCTTRRPSCSSTTRSTRNPSIPSSSELLWPMVRGPSIRPSENNQSRRPRGPTRTDTPPRRSAHRPW